LLVSSIIESISALLFVTNGAIVARNVNLAEGCEAAQWKRVEV
jgi:hypothetical protein